MDNVIGNTTNQTSPVQTPPVSPQRENEVSLQQQQQQRQRAEAAQENEQPQDRRPDPEDRIGTQIDTQA